MEKINDIELTQQKNEALLNELGTLFFYDWLLIDIFKQAELVCKLGSENIENKKQLTQEPRFGHYARNRIDVDLLKEL